MRPKNLFEQTLFSLSQHNILNDLILIGGWCFIIYREHFDNSHLIPVLRTLDIDFLIPTPVKRSHTADLPAVLSNLGFDLAISYPDGVEKYVHPELELEFMVPARGKAVEKFQFVRKLGVKAQPLRYMSLLVENIMVARFSGIELRVPRPSVFAIHKLIVSTYRKVPEKRKRDEESALSLLQFCKKVPREWALAVHTCNTMPAGWSQRVEGVLERLDSALLKNLKA
ncbi:MAG: hypothetical protein GXO69_00720 [Acidobacteria bacterium]|nr:hypothetical protein [Acidobacteriota bacterium]